MTTASFIIYTKEGFGYSYFYITRSFDLDDVIKFISERISTEPPDCLDDALYSLLTNDWASFDNTKPIIEYLILIGANINRYYRGQETLLGRVCRWGDVNYAKLLINGGADVNIKDSQGVSPLKNAIRSSSYKIVKLLLTSGCIVDNDILHYALTTTPIFPGYNYYTSEYDDYCNGVYYYGIIKLLLRAKCYVDEKYNDKIQPLLLEISMEDKMKDTIPTLEDKIIELGQQLEGPGYTITRYLCNGIPRINTLKHIIVDLEKTFDDLQYRPNGPGYLDAKSEFEKIQKCV